MSSEHYDVIIIGTGAGGGTLAHKLAPSGKRILLLERGGYLPREPEFGEVEHYGGLSPAWPISYQDLEPYYAEAERLYLVHGTAGEDHTEPPRSGPFPFPAVSHEPRIQQLHDDFARTGHHPFHLPVGVDMNETDSEQGRCVRCDRFDGFPCLTDGKADAHVCCVRPALATHDNLTLLTHSRVVRLGTDRSGQQVSSVVVDRGGAEERYSADIVVV